MKPDRTIETYPDTGGRYRWRAKSKNGKVTAVSGESFASAGNAARAANREAEAWRGVVSVIENKGTARG
jgi:uncharacterized protein YegP (UPF0339 family)